MNYCFSFRYAEKNNLPVLNHVSLPRVGALHTIVDTVGPGRNSSPGGDSSGDATVNCDGMNFVYNINIFNVEYAFLRFIIPLCNKTKGYIRLHYRSPLMTVIQFCILPIYVLAEYFSLKLTLCGSSLLQK
jgi:hypothetical protein